MKIHSYVVIISILEVCRKRSKKLVSQNINLDIC